MELLVVILIILSVSAIAFAAKHGAEAAQVRREERWGGFSSPVTAPVPGHKERIGGAGSPPAPGAAAPGPAAAARPSGGAFSEPGKRPDSAKRTGPSERPPLRPPEAGPKPKARSPKGSGGPREALRAFRRGDGKAAEGGSGAGRSAAVATRPAGRERASSAPSRADEARRAVCTAAESASATARAVGASASAAFRRQPAAVDLNSATVNDLQNLPGVGVRAAQRIVAHRERNGAFTSVEDLAAVEGFDRHRVSRLAPRATV